MASYLNEQEEDFSKNKPPAAMLQHSGTEGPMGTNSSIVDLKAERNGQLG
jgi:hypothetical protein